MSYKKFGFVSFFIFASASSAFANGSPAYNSNVSVTTYQANHNAAPTMRNQQTASRQFVSSSANSPQAARKVRIIRETLPGQSRVIQSTSDKSVIAVPNHASGFMKIIKPSMRKMKKTAMPNLYTE